MARTGASLPAGSRITDSISPGVIAKFLPSEQVRDVLAETKRTQFACARGRRLRDHPGLVHALFDPRSFALPAGGCAVAARPLGAPQGGRQVGHLAGAQPIGGCAAAPALHRPGWSGRREAHANTDPLGLPSEKQHVSNAAVPAEERTGLSQSFRHWWCLLLGPVKSNFAPIRLVPSIRPNPAGSVLVDGAPAASGTLPTAIPSGNSSTR
jgi:hypothetical protein